MINLFLPDEYLKNVYEIDISSLKTRGIKTLICDIDNTLVTYDEKEPDQDLYLWFDKLKNNEISVVFISNNSYERVGIFNEKLGYLAYAKSNKPSRKMLRDAMIARGSDYRSTAIVGDQIFTDIFAGKRLKLYCILVKPIKDKKTLFFMLKRMLEKPILYYYKKRSSKYYLERSSK